MPLVMQVHSTDDQSMEPRSNTLVKCVVWTKSAHWFPPCAQKLALKGISQTILEKEHARVFFFKLGSMNN